MPDQSFDPRKLWLPAPVVAALLALAFSVAGAWWSIRAEIKDMKDKLQLNDRWSASMMHVWSDRLADQNPTLRVPATRQLQDDFRPRAMGSIHQPKTPQPN
jgi:hypothetical protein